MYEVIVQDHGCVWRGMDHTNAENAYRRYVARTRKGGDYEDKTVELTHNGQPVKTWRTANVTEQYNVGTCC